MDLKDGRFLFQQNSFCGFIEQAQQFVTLVL